MAVYSLTELETEIAEAKAAIRRVRRAVSYGTGNVRVERERLKDLTGHLQWLHDEKMVLENAGVRPRVLAGLS